MMHLGYNEACRRHDPGPSHPDTVRRLDVLIDALEGHERVTWIEPDPIETATVERVHAPAYLEELEAFCANGGGAWDPDTTASVGTWEASHASAGIAAWAARTAMDTHADARTPFALCRPPGHHAMPDTAMGFCFFNNVAIGAEAALDAGAKRVAILDWDVHHANGTEAYVTSRPETALVSMHQRGLYPGTGHFAPASDGERVLNLPLPTGLGDADYLAALEVIAIPAIASFDPDVLLVSCGFDAHLNDVLASQHLTAGGYGLLADALGQFCADRGIGLGFVLEGGYALDAIGNCALAVVDACCGICPPAPADSVDERLVDTFDRVDAHPLLNT